MPRATWRIMPARTISLWLTTSASAGSSRRVGTRRWESRVTSPLAWRPVLLQALERQPAVAPGRARGHRHGDEDDLADLLVAAPRLRRLLGVRVDAPRALRDVRDAEGDQLLGLDGERAVRERLLVELEPRAIRVGRQLAHAAEYRLHVDTVERHPALLVPPLTPPAARCAAGAARLLLLVGVRRVQ